MDDAGIFMENWLKYGSYNIKADIAPGSGDSLVNMLDFARFARDWLNGI